MENTNQNLTTSNTSEILASLGQDVFENANTIAKWLLSQPEGNRLELAQGLYNKLMQDASQSRQYHGNGHACVRLCSFVQQCFKSNDPVLKEWASSEAIASELFHFYLEWYEHDPHRALRLVLDILVTSTTNNPRPGTALVLKNSVLETLVLIITRKYPKQLTKSGLQCLDHLLSKKVISLDDIALKYREVEPSLAGVPSLSLWKSFAFHLFSWMEFTHVCPLTGKALVHVFRGLESAALDNETSSAAGFSVEVWRQWLQDVLIQNPGYLEDIKNYVLVPIFKTDRPAALRLLEVFNKSQPLTTIDQELSDQGILLQLATLELGKKFGLVEEPSKPQPVTSEPSAQIALQETVLDSLLAHPSISVRSSAFSLLVSSQATTKPFSTAAFNLLKRHLAAFHADYDAKVRNEVLGLTKSLLKRVKNIITVAQRALIDFANREAQGISNEKPKPPPKKKAGSEAALKDAFEAMALLDHHTSFIKWYLDFLKSELLPTASYQRHITAMKAALLTLRVGKHAAAVDDIVDEDVIKVIASDSTWIRLLLDLLLDPFDDVRDSAATLLSLIPQELVAAPTSPSEGSPTLLDVLREFCERASKLADRTGRADHSDGAARSQGLFCSWLNGQSLQIEHLSRIVTGIEDKIAKAENDLGHAAIENPVHANFAAIGYVWQVLAKQTYPETELENLRQVQHRIFGAAQRIWLAVKHVLCDDSPEGHLPEEMEDIEGLDTKDLLSYSFRAVHESSNLLRLIVGTLRLKAVPGVPFPPLDVFKQTGYLTFEQLANLRHRGAFSTVSYTFTNCCQLTQNLKNVFPGTEEAERLLRDWYNGAIECIMTQASTTRRSAGIPSLIAAVLSANAVSPSFEEVFCNLEEIGKKPVRQTETDGSNLPQVHALNCLREIFRSSLLSKRAEGYLARTLHLAATSLKSEVWAIRNCGLLLLRSLIDCLLGTGESKAIIESGWDGHSVRISYNKYPALPDILLGLLETAGGEIASGLSNSAAAEAVFPALDIIRRAGPPEEHRDELRKRIEGYLGSRIWHVREIAARTLCSFLLQEDWAAEISQLLESAGSSMNQVHGTLLTARFVIERKTDLGVDLKSDPASLDLLLGSLSDRAALFKSCAEVEAAYLEILNLLTKLQCIEAVEPTDSQTSPVRRRDPPSALLDMEQGLKLVYETAASANVEKLRTHLLETLTRDINTASRMLEVLPVAWAKASSNPLARSGLTNLYLEVCATSPAPEARSQSLTNLASLLNTTLSQPDVPLDSLPAVDQLDTLMANLLSSDINPDLSHAITEASGTIMAVLSLYSVPDFGQRLQHYGAVITHCLDVNNSFDTRFAAASSLKAFFLPRVHNSINESYLPALSALYDSLIDDDDEVREIAAQAAAGVLGETMIAPTTADRLVSWLVSQPSFASSEEFKAQVVRRMTGSMVSAEEQLHKAMDFDDSLFAAEEQNLFIDEVRETLRWSQALASSSTDENLKKWTEEGLESLITLAEEKWDGPLGWASDQHVFAAGARVVLAAVASVKSAGASAGEDKKNVEELLQKFREVGERAKVHGSLLEMATL
ncbi:thyroid adenoma-associated protein [Podospora australis]|uniref:Thyroid adenoma-associated protein n=1 Tax=Podospora australis TaxID=1536484 RepID=A0AAN7AK35_9PEZI|nr:thyroid adenoma-associated protein [Podospora australis]